MDYDACGMAICVGTSGFSYKEWKGIFYPSDMRDPGFLPYYASRLNGVEIDSTFYRMPTPKTLDAWVASTPPSFRFAVKASQKITHFERLAVPSEALTYLLELLPRLGERLGVVLYQLPPNFKLNLERLEAFLAVLPPSPRSALEFRHLSWFCDQTFEALEKRGVALCINDNDDFESPVRLTAKHTYVRLRKQEYSPEARVLWKERLSKFAADGVEVFAFIKHQDNPEAPLIALDFAKGIAEPPV
ncbi:MAG TPA: DUF72 domain-containing protein [Polyangiaceae bacterium]|jgi:uncharacterized protein YecE (DUF72 family)